MRSEYLAIQRDLETLRQTSGRQYVLNSPLCESQVLQFEAEYGITLPADYRDFLLYIGNGGAGPGEGLEQLGHAYNVDWGESPGLVGNLAEPFPYTDRWNEGPIDASRSIDEQHQQQDDYWSSRHVAGALPICHLGCNLRQVLIVTGSERGHVWYDDRADWQGLYPDSTVNTNRLSFLEWYRCWLSVQLNVQRQDARH